MMGGGETYITLITGILGYVSQKTNKNNLYKFFTIKVSSGEYRHVSFIYS